MQRILIVDDDMFFRKLLTKLLGEQGYDIRTAESGEEALQILQTQTFDLMISDINMAPMNGIELLEKTLESYADQCVIMVTVRDEIEVAVDTMKKGAFDFLAKPIQLKELFSTVQHALSSYRIFAEDKSPGTEPELLAGLVSESASMRNVCDRIQRVAPTNVIVLLCGERGIDKELVARALHSCSLRKEAPFIAADCSVLTEAIDLKLFKQARRGTLFLNNIEAVPLDQQEKLFDIIQNNQTGTGGGAKKIGSILVDVRILIASSVELNTLVKQGAFSENLYRQLNALRLDIPPLRNRREDIPFIIDQILRRNLGQNAELPALDPKAMELLYNHIWPGNACELEAAVVHALALAKDGVITKEMLPEETVAFFDEGVRSNIITTHRTQMKGLAFKTLLRRKQEEMLGRRDEPSPKAEPVKELSQRRVVVKEEKKKWKWF